MLYNRLHRFLFASIFVFLFSCKGNVSDEANVKKISFTIEGMTCEEGCAGFLQRKLNKAEGVSGAEIDFEQEKATVIFDDAKTSTEDVVKIVANAAGGIYTVSDIVVLK